MKALIRTPGSVLVVFALVFAPVDHIHAQVKSSKLLHEQRVAILQDLVEKQ